MEETTTQDGPGTGAGATPVKDASSTPAAGKDATPAKDTAATEATDLVAKEASAAKDTPAKDTSAKDNVSASATAKDNTPKIVDIGGSKQSEMNMAKARMQLSEEDIREFKEIFNLVDTDGSGAISNEELGQLVESVGMKLTPAELGEMIAELDADQSGEIEVDEFISILCKDLALDYSADEIGNAFKMFSRNAPPGLIRMSDLEEALKVYLKKVNQSEINHLLKQFEDCVIYLSQVVDPDGFPVPFFRYQDYINLMMRRGPQY